MQQEHVTQVMNDPRRTVRLPCMMQGAFPFLFCSMCYHAGGSKPMDHMPT